MQQEEVARGQNGDCRLFGEVAMSRYRKIEVRTWSDEKFRTLSAMPPSGQGLWFFLLTGRHTTAIPGLFRAGRAGMAEELNWDQEAFDKAFLEVSTQGMAKADFKARLVWLPKAIEHNKPESPNVVRGWRVELDLLPECDLKREAIEGIRHSLENVGPSYVEAFDEIISGKQKALAKASPKPSEKTSPNQEQEQEQEQEDKREPDGSCPDEGPNAVPNCPFDNLIDLYEEKLPVLPTIRRSLFKTGKGGTAMKARWKWVLTALHERGDRVGQRLATTAEEGVVWFGKFFDYVAASDFLTGKSGKFNGCTLQWLMTASKFEDVLSGKFHDQVREAA
ncbi:hypothetical protein PSQ39_06460 [Curvibacter sp. HBC28]|uniref:Uncharacterized protein n=1 Tax=Curvibacter microcysteis TaxID=3026419 RepID=A0ABT5MCG4_9BURK|nr:hypothetical protein [Curvibacter sp. HBC28]MDD0814268.1 hypothetical protein [Curvibacter sp. HBC28]